MDFCVRLNLSAYLLNLLKFNMMCQQSRRLFSSAAEHYRIYTYNLIGIVCYVVAAWNVLTSVSCSIRDVMVEVTFFNLYVVVVVVC